MNQLINLNPAVDLAAKEHSAAAATQFYHEGHEVLKKPFWSIFLRDLRVLRGEKVLSEMSGFGLLHCKDRSAVNRNQTHDLNRRQQRKRRDGQFPVILCSLCFLLFKTFCSKSNMPRPSMACRKEGPGGRGICAQSRGGRGERVLGGSLRMI
jgi:hypothetical protein